MSILEDLLKHEVAFTEATIGRLGFRREIIEQILSVAHLATRYTTPFGDTNTLGLARLMLDSAVAIEQAFLCALRAQPKLGWASMRLAAEALKDLDCIQRVPNLYSLWINVGGARSTRDSVKAQQAYKGARKEVTRTWTTEVCQESMRLSSIFGSHPNATSLATMGPTTIDAVAKTAQLPARVTEAAALDWHLDQIIRHATLIVAALAHARSQTLGESDRAELTHHRDQLVAAAKPFMEAAVSNLQDDGGGDPDAC